MDHMLALTEKSPTKPMSIPGTERIRAREEACLANIKRLKQVRERTYQDLIGTLAWVRELVSMIHLAKFTGAPASRAQELVAQIAAAVEALSEVSLEETPVECVEQSLAKQGHCA